MDTVAYNHTGKQSQQANEKEEMVGRKGEEGMLLSDRFIILRICDVDCLRARHANTLV
jgi:hypothetical protein